MGDFFSPPNGFAPPPEPDSPPPDFVTAGLNLGKGIDKSGLTGSWLNGLLDILVRWVGAALGLVLSIAGSLLTYIIRTLQAADEAAAPVYSQLVADELAALFGVSVNSSALAGVKNATSRAGVGDQVGAFILQSIIAPTSAATGNGIEPDDAGAKKFLGTTLTMEVEGWLHAWLYDALSYHELEKFGDLKDGVARVLGLGRMSRQVFAPPLKVFVHDPYLAKLNAAYRPEHLPIPSAIRQYFRGALSRSDLSTILGRQGIREAYIDFLIIEHQKYLSDADVDYLVSRGAWPQDQAIQYLSEQGWDTATAERRLSIMHDQRIDRYRREINAAAGEAFVRGEIPHDQLATIVQASGLSDEEQTWFMRVMGTKRELTVTHLSRADIERLIKEGVMNFGDLEQWANRVNMPIDEERFLELGIAVQESTASRAAQAKTQAAAAKAAAAQAKTQAAITKAAQASAQAVDKGVTLAEAESLVVDGLWTFEHLNSYLQARGYSVDAVAAIDHLVHVKLDKLGTNQAAAGAAHASVGGKSLTVAEMEKAAVDGLISVDELSRYLTGVGYQPGDAQILVELTQHAIDQQRLKDAAKSTAAAATGKRGVSLPDVERAVRLGVTPIDTYTSALTAAGYDAAGIALLEGILRKQMAADQATAAKRAAATTAAGGRGVSLPQLEQEIIAGVRPIGDYTAELVTIGYSAADAGDLTKLLQLRVDQAKATAAKRATAGAATASRGLSIADVERAVKLGVLKLADYTTALKSAGFDKHAIDVLTAALKTQMGATAQAQTATNAAAKVAKAKGISLPEIERAVLAGIKTVGEYSATLTQLGYGAADVSTLTALLQDKVDQAAAAKARHADAIGAATVRGIDLAKAESAVVDGTTTMGDYDAQLAALGYDDVDRSIIEGLLQKRVDAAAAKAAKAAGTTAAPPQ